MHTSAEPARGAPVAERRPPGVAALGVFFAAGSLIALVAAVSLLSPGGLLEPVWRLNPRARTAFSGLGFAAPALLVLVAAACGVASVGIFRRRRWGHRTAVGLISLNLLGDTVNAALGIEPRAAVGIPIAGALLVYLLSRRVRGYFGGEGRRGAEPGAGGQ